MNNVKKFFSIRDLENLSGIKAHTIRIWEKRYQMLLPERTATNIRTYSLSSLQKLLNITLLYNNGYKISKIAKIPEKCLAGVVREIGFKDNTDKHAINALKFSMLNFDQDLFLKTYGKLSEERSFSVIFWEIFIPFLEDLGLLWQIAAISPAHEHFITHLIKQKIYTNIESLQAPAAAKTDKVYVLFLPENEIHEIGLLFINYELLVNGARTIYLGQTMPVENLVDLQNYYDNIYYISYFTVAPTKDKLKRYIDDFNKSQQKKEQAPLWILGRQTHFLDPEKLPDNIRMFRTIRELTSAIKTENP